MAVMQNITKKLSNHIFFMKKIKTKLTAEKNLGVMFDYVS